MDSTPGKSKLKRLLTRRVMAPHWLQVTLVGIWIYAMTRVALTNPDHLLLIILGSATFAVAYTIWHLISPQQTEDTTMDSRIGFWDRLRTYHVWSLSLICIANSLYVLSCVFSIPLH